MWILNLHLALPEAQKPGGINSVDDYQKSGPKTPKASSRERERDTLRRMERLLEIDSEREFIEELRNEAGVDPNHPKFKQMITIWRERHP
jgi:hypothetical protein